MSTGDLNLDLFLGEVEPFLAEGDDTAVEYIRRRYPSLNERQARELFLSFVELSQSKDIEKATLVATTPPSFRVHAQSTKNTVSELLNSSKQSILMTGYSLSSYFDELIDLIIQKSQQGVVVRFFANNIENKNEFDKLLTYKGRFLQIFNYPKSDDKMAALHAKVISVDSTRTLITSANLSYHGQEGNIELGTIVESTRLAKQVEELFASLISLRVFEKIR